MASNWRICRQTFGALFIPICAAIAVRVRSPLTTFFSLSCLEKKRILKRHEITPDIFTKSDDMWPSFVNTFPGPGQPTHFRGQVSRKKETRNYQPLLNILITYRILIVANTPLPGKLLCGSQYQLKNNG